MRKAYDVGAPSTENALLTLAFRPFTVGRAAVKPVNVHSRRSIQIIVNFLWCQGLSRADY